MKLFRTKFFLTKFLYSTMEFRICFHNHSHWTLKLNHTLLATIGIDTEFEVIGLLLAEVIDVKEELVAALAFELGSVFFLMPRGDVRLIGKRRVVFCFSLVVSVSLKNMKVYYSTTFQMFTKDAILLIYYGLLTGYLFNEHFNMCVHISLYIYNIDIIK